MIIDSHAHYNNNAYRIDNLEELLMLERDAIVKKCIKAARRLIKDGYRFPDCPEADRMKDAWIGWQSYARDYILSNCIAEEGKFTPSTPFYNAYMQYCNEYSLPYGTSTAFVRLAKNLFGIPLDEEMRETVDGKQMRGIRDVSFIGTLK